MTAAAAPAKETPKQALTGLLISFVMVLVFRGFCFESFHIPTGSMAPTLMGEHHRIQSEETGYSWAVNSWREYWGWLRHNNASSAANPVGAINVADPMTGWRTTRPNAGIRGGDRIGIVKYNRFYRPSRWDVIVVKWPAVPDESYIKRLVGLPGETLWFADGDVFVKRGGTAGPTAGASDEGWEIQRKPARVQRAVWSPVYSSECAPLDKIHDGRVWECPWRSSDTETALRAIVSPKEGATISWDGARNPVLDWTPYNDYGKMADQFMRFPVSDVRVRAAIEPPAGAPAPKVSASIDARGSRFTATIEGDAATLEMRSEPADKSASDATPDEGGRVVVWRKSAKIKPLVPGRATNIELWHADQRVQLWVDGTLIVEGTYEWGPIERLRRAIKPGIDVDALLAPPQQRGGNPLANPRIYREVSASWRIWGAATLYRVGLDRDLHYQAAWYRNRQTEGSKYWADIAGKPALGTHPSNLPTLTGEEYFLCGDNSANSADSRLVDNVEPWVAHRIDDHLGVINRRLISGKAAVVFWPAAHPVGLGDQRYNVVPDVGRVRWIR